MKTTSRWFSQAQDTLGTDENFSHWGRWYDRTKLVNKLLKTDTISSSLKKIFIVDL